MDETTFNFVIQAANSLSAMAIAILWILHLIKQNNRLMDVFEDEYKRSRNLPSS